MSTGFAAPFTPEAAVEIVTDAVRHARADHVEVALLARSGEYTRFAGERIHQPQHIVERQLAVRSIVDGQVGRAATSAPDRVADAVETATAIARRLAESSGRRSGDARVGEPAQAPDLQLWHDDTAAFDSADRVALAGRAMRLAAEAGGTAAGMLGQAVTQLAVATTGGIVRHAMATEASGSLTVTVADGSAHWTDLHRSSDALRAEPAIEATVRRAMAARGRVALPHGTYTVVLGPEAVGELLGFFGVLGFSGDLAAAGVGTATRAGQRVASMAVTIADDALAPCGLPFPFDREGTPKRAVPFLSKGVVGEPVTDLATAGALGRTSTGHAHVAREEAPAPVPANVVMSAGTATEEALIAGVDRGVYVERFWYTRLVDRQAATITGVSRDGCFLIEDGELGHPVAGARFTQPVLDFLATVDAVGADRRSQPIMNVWNGAVSAPAVRGHGFRFGPRPIGDGAQ